ncbi:hypothetical protein KFK09_014501 [Dendrobium nobile]|uniref:Uncharacterized protein n=1 Tax=Dendrobium nobile TaxID=94219 RepID=A0A8T3B1Y3_DENNO|nr:hypothetical protein KFK09_014501 [Dendrobium nobile]
MYTINFGLFCGGFFFISVGFLFPLSVFCSLSFMSGSEGFCGMFVLFFCSSLSWRWFGCFVPIICWLVVWELCLGFLCVDDVSLLWLILLVFFWCGATRLLVLWWCIFGRIRWGWGTGCGCMWFWWSLGVLFVFSRLAPLTWFLAYWILLLPSLWVVFGTCRLLKTLSFYMALCFGGCFWFSYYLCRSLKLVLGSSGFLLGSCS